MTWTPYHHGTTRLILPQGFEVEVTWACNGDEGYKVGFDGKVWLKKRFKNLEEAKAQGVELAKRQLRGALEYLGG